jgi:pimeloyl-ACP methyl ester carboxylesterase
MSVLRRIIVYYFQANLCILEPFLLSLFFIHGAGATSSVWHLQTIHFKDSIAVELPGHPNGSGLTTVDDYLRVVDHQIDEKGKGDPIIVGHSMGGAIAIELALSRPKLRGLVLVGTGARLRVHPELLRLVKEDYAAVTKLLALWSVSTATDPIIGERLVRDLTKVKSGVMLGDLTACNEFDRMERVGEIRCRTLIICGKDDEMTPVKYSKYLHEKIKGSELMIIPDAGHSVMLEKHREFNQALEGFLASL